VRSGEVAQRAGVNIETLRYYERRGLLPEPPRTPSGHRRYAEETVRFLHAIKEAQAVGFTLSEIEEYLGAARRSAVGASEALRVRAAAKIDEIDTRIAALRRMRDELARVVGCACDSLDHCTCGAAYLARKGREPARPSLLHVTNGESAGNTLRQTTLGGAVLSWQDVLHEGPVPAGPRSDLLRARAAFLSEWGWGSRRAILSMLDRRDRLFVEALRGGTRVVLWFEHDLYDGLQLLDALGLAAGSGASPELIVVDSFPGKPRFRGLGELRSEELETLWPLRTAATPEAMAAAAAAWHAVRAPEPVALAEWVERGSEDLSLVATALLRLLEELPGSDDGLSGTERRALQAVAAGAATPGAAFVAAQELEEAPFLGDAWFYRALASLGQGGTRLVETRTGETLPAPPPLGDPHSFPSVPLRLTTHGVRVLDGKADRVDLLGIDRWVGGTRLTHDRVWRWDSDARLLLAPA
jgi:DNA-binding transcriptional MerR regulator